VRWLIASVLLFTSLSVQAQNPLYAELNLAAGGVSHSDLDFVPVFGSVSVGSYVYPGIGIELFGDSGFESGSDDGLELSFNEAVGAGMRLESPARRGMQGYIVLGAVEYTLEQRVENTSSLGLVREDFTGMRISVGLMQRLVRLPALLVSAEYRHYNAGERLRVDAFVLGLRGNVR